MTPAEQVELTQRLCTCCGVDPVNTKLGIFCNNMDLGDLGAGYVMYFRMIIFFTGIWCFYLLINVIKVISNMKGSYCSDSSTYFSSTGVADSAKYLALGYPPCTSDWITVHSVANYGTIIVDEQEKSWVMIFFIAYWVFLSLCKAWLKSTNLQIDVNNDTPSDWTLIVRGLPVDEPAEQIQANFEAFGALGKEPCYVKKVNLAFNCEAYVKLHAEVNRKKRLMKLMQVKETAKAKETMRERLKKDGKDDKQYLDRRPDKTDYSQEFQKKFEDITVQSSEVDPV